MQYEFGTGQLVGKSLNAGVQTGVVFGALQGVTLDIAYTEKELYGQNQLPLAVARGTGKITGKADFAQFNAQVYNDLFFGVGSVSTGAVRLVVGEAQTPAITANVCSANVTNGGNFVTDYGVRYAANGSVLTVSANTPAVAGQYSYNASNGMYSFANAMANVPLIFSYTWNDTVNGKKITITNQLLGNAPQFMCSFSETYQGKQLTVTLNACMSSKLSLVTKLEDFTIPSFDFSAFADASGTIGTMNFEE